jgi:hypothetical protein
MPRKKHVAGGPLALLPSKLHRANRTARSGEMERLTPDYHESRKGPRPPVVGGKGILLPVYYLDHGG